MQKRVFILVLIFAAVFCSPIDDTSDKLKSSKKKKPVTIVIDRNEQEDEYIPPCPKNEVWSRDRKCDVTCDFDDSPQHGSYSDNFGYGHEYFRQSYSGGENRCRRSVTDYLFELGKNVTTRTNLGYDPEPAEEFFARTRHLSHKDDDQEYVIVEQGYHVNRPPRGRCVCRDGFARGHNNFCVRFGNCPLAECPPGQKYLHCGPTCEPDCKNWETFSYNCGSCKSGCFCPRGYVRDSHGHCKPPNLCTPQEIGTTTTTPIITIPTKVTLPSLPPVILPS